MYCVIDAYTGEVLVDQCFSRNEAQDKASAINEKIIKERTVGVGLAYALNLNGDDDFMPMMSPVFKEV